jgi:addiction module RelE/StbE family toxin
MKVEWTRKAERDRAAILGYIAGDNPNAANRMNSLFNEAANKLAEQPRMGKAGEMSGTRELIPHKSYRMVYQIDAETVSILTLIHTARQWPPES